MAEQPNDASRKSKAEGDRWSPVGEQTSDHGEESSSQKSEASRGKPKCGPPHSDMDLNPDLERDSRRDKR
jgi:hypothetical protein